MGAVRRGVLAERCAYCGALLPTNIEGVEAWRVGNRFACNEFCADGIPEEIAPGASPALESSASCAPNA